MTQETSPKQAWIDQAMIYQKGEDMTTAIEETESLFLKAESTNPNLMLWLSIDHIVKVAYSQSGQVAYVTLTNGDTESIVIDEESLDEQLALFTR